ncbi:MAG TPA: hypothetical protein VEJ86_07860 [Candidatus Binataceae bacterium]|nr:hypothetical protein [Candidatus Binataceae bacterium]
MKLASRQDLRAENRKTALILLGIMIALIATAVVDILVSHHH